MSDAKTKEAYEAVEVKLGKPVELAMVNTAYEKFMNTRLSRYHILSTAGVLAAEREPIARKILKIKQIHGYQVIVNGVLETLAYYLRIVQDTGRFLEIYTNLMPSDETIRYEHKAAWNQIAANYTLSEQL